MKAARNCLLELYLPNKDREPLCGEMRPMLPLLFEGEKQLGKPPAEAWNKLSDVRFLVRCIPGAEVIGEPEPASAALKLRPGFAFVRGTLDVTLTVIDKTEPTSVRLALHSKAIGASSDVEARLEMSAAEAGTAVHWSVEVTSLTGLLKLVPQGLIRGAAQSIIDDVWEEVETKLGA
jgi:uncharacterized protein